MFKDMQLSCQGFVACEYNEGVYTCHVGDSNYIFKHCLILLLKPLDGASLPPIDDIMKDLHFEYTIQNTLIIEEPLKVAFSQRPKKYFETDYWFDCTITRPLRCMDQNESIDDIRLIFTSDYVMEAQFSVERTWKDKINVTQKLPSTTTSGTCNIL